MLSLKGLRDFLKVALDFSLECGIVVEIYDARPFQIRVADTVCPW